MDTTSSSAWLLALSSYNTRSGPKGPDNLQNRTSRSKGAGQRAIRDAVYGVGQVMNRVVSFPVLEYKQWAEQLGVVTALQQDAHRDSFSTS